MLYKEGRKAEGRHEKGKRLNSERESGQREGLLIKGECEVGRRYGKRTINER